MISRLLSAALLLLGVPGHIFAQEIRLRDGGAVRAFELSPRRQSDGDEAIILFEKGVRRNEFTRRRLTDRIVVNLAPGVDPDLLAARLGARAGAELSYAPGRHIFQAQNDSSVFGLSEALREERGVLSAHPILARKLRPRALPNDPLFTNQWHLLNTGQRGATVGTDIRITNAWEKYRGEGVTVAVVDDGLLGTHPDLSANVDTSLGVDVRDGDSDPSPEGLPGVDAFDVPRADSHGTAVAGIIAARGNNEIGVAGVAYEATLVGVRLLGDDIGDDQEAEALSYLPERIQVSNNSWGADDDGQSVGGAGDLVLLALEHGAATGRSGKGTIYVFAAGNGGEFDDNANYDTYANSIHTIAVGAINDRGRRASYSERGACLIVSAPGGNDASRFQAITTTDLLGNFGFNYSGAGSPALPEIANRDYTQTFNGTSASTPVVSGVVALMLDANPDLGWRDVQEILLRSATRTDPGNAEWRTNAAGFHFNPNFGAGLVNASAAVTLAETWVNLGKQTNFVQERGNIRLAVLSDAPAELAFELPTPGLRVEHVTLQIDSTVAARGGLEITLESPGGTISPLAEAHDDPNPDFAHTSMSVFHWGESSSGVWKVRIANSGWFPPDPEIETFLNGAKLVVLGTQSDRASPAFTAIDIDREGIHLSVSAARFQICELQSTTDFSTWTTVNRVAAPSGSFTMTAPLAAEAKIFFRLLTPP